MRIQILSILIALTIAIAGPLAFAEPDRTAEQDTVDIEVKTEVSEIVEVEEIEEDCTNSADDDGDGKVDCDDSDCALAPNCKGGS